MSLNNLCDPFRTERNTWLCVAFRYCLPCVKAFAKAVFDYSGGRGADADAVYVDKEILRSGGLFNCELKQSSPECLDRGAPALYNAT